MAIHCTENQIYNFANKVHEVADSTSTQKVPFDEAIRLLENKCHMLKTVGEKSYRDIHNSISNAEHGISRNKRAIENLRGYLDDIKRSISACQNDQQRAGLIREKGMIENRINQVFRMKSSLESMVNQLHAKSENMYRALQNVDALASKVNQVRNAIDSNDYNFKQKMGELEKGTNTALVYAHKINESLSHAAGTSSDSGKLISIVNSAYLYNMASSLIKTYQEIGDSDSGYAQLLSSFMSVIQDEVSRGLAEASQRMLDTFGKELQDFPRLATDFKDAGVALDYYQKLAL